MRQRATTRTKIQQQRRTVRQAHIAAADLEDVALEVIAQRVALDLVRDALVIESTPVAGKKGSTFSHKHTANANEHKTRRAQFAVIVYVDHLLRAGCRIGNVQLHTDTDTVRGVPRARRTHTRAKRAQAHARGHTRYIPSSLRRASIPVPAQNAQGKITRR